MTGVILGGVAALGISLAACGGSAGHGTPSGGGGNPHVHNVTGVTSPSNDRSHSQQPYAVKMTSCGPTAHFDVRNVSGPTAEIGVTMEWVDPSGHIAVTNYNFTDALPRGVAEHLAVEDTGDTGTDYHGPIAACVATWHHISGESPSGAEHPITEINPEGAS